MHRHGDLPRLGALDVRPPVRRPQREHAHEGERADLDAARGVAIMAANPSCIKRPIVEHPGGLLVGFKAPEWAAVFG